MLGKEKYMDSKKWHNLSWFLSGNVLKTVLAIIDHTEKENQYIT